jgi:type I restriction enzyme S subunit
MEKARRHERIMIRNEKRQGYKKTKVGWIPDDWDCVPFATIFDLTMVSLEPSPSVKYREIGVRSHGKGIFHKPPVTGESLGDKRVFHCQPGTLVFNIVFAWEQAVAVISESERGFIASHRFPMFKGRKNQASEAYYLLFFKTRRGKEQLTIASPGGAGRNKTLGQADLEVLPVPHPPFSEQIAIAELLACWDKAIQTLTLKTDNKRLTNKGLSKKLLTGQIRLPGYSTKWKHVKLCEVASVNDHVLEQHTDEDCEFYYIDLACVDRGHVSLPTGKIQFKNAPSRARRKFKKTDVLMATVRPNLLGHCYVTFDAEDKICSTGFAVVSERPGVLDNRFFYAQLFSEKLNTDIQTLISGSSYPALNSTDVENLAFLLPPLEEQRAIAAVLSASDSEIEALDRRLKLLKDQKKFLLNNLVTGTIRLPQFCNHGKHRKARK